MAGDGLLLYMAPLLAQHLHGPTCLHSTRTVTPAVAAVQSARAMPTPTMLTWWVLSVRSLDQSVQIAWDVPVPVRPGIRVGTQVATLQGAWTVVCIEMAWVSCNEAPHRESVWCSERSACFVRGESWGFDTQPPVSDAHETSFIDHMPARVTAGAGHAGMDGATPQNLQTATNHTWRLCEQNGPTGCVCIQTATTHSESLCEQDVPTGCFCLISPRCTRSGPLVPL